MARYVSKGETMLGVGQCIGFYSCNCGQEHQVFEHFEHHAGIIGPSKSNGKSSCRGEWFTPMLDMVHDKPVELRKVQVPQGE